MGDIYTNHVRDLAAAEDCYRKITEVDPGHVQGHHNLCVVLVEQGRLQVARDCLARVQEMAPNEEYIRRHLQIVENRIRCPFYSSPYRPKTFLRGFPGGEQTRVLSISFYFLIFTTLPLSDSGSPLAKNFTGNFFPLQLVQ
jgi:hypothetical protein